MNSVPLPFPSASLGSPPPGQTLVDHQRLSHAFFLVAFVVVLYDYLLTLPAEVHFIWLRPKRLSSYWFMLNRYFALSTSVIMAVFTFADFAPEVCSSLQEAQKIFLLVQEIIIFAILGLRVYAMFNLDRRLLTVLCLTCVSVVVVVAWLANTNAAMPQPVPGSPLLALPQCAALVSHTSALRLAGAWEAQLAVDVLVFGLTVLRAVQHYRYDDKYRSSLLDCLVRDGAMYFVAILLANSMNILMYYFGDPILAGSLSWFAGALSATLVARLMLNLHAVADAGIYQTDAGGWGVTREVDDLLPTWSVHVHMPVPIRPSDDSSRASKEEPSSEV
ncbi:hypothetical protein B0H19DRAFT_1192924 [Mycena capillaripes]|nr:hypothetical protein B0H19DRAFT_1192924 [Mycena capillaripes]